MKKIFIPKVCTTYTENGNFYVVFPYGLEGYFIEWCKDNNIGHKEENRRDIIKGDCLVFTAERNKTIFI